MSHLLVTTEASETVERDSSVNWNMLTVSFTQLVSSVKKWSPSGRNATACVTRGALHLSALAFFLHAISKAGHAFYF